jgi:hypothetical protein
MSDVTTRALEILQRLGAGNPFDAVPEGAQREFGDPADKEIAQRQDHQHREQEGEEALAPGFATFSQRIAELDRVAAGVEAAGIDDMGFGALVAVRLQPVGKTRDPGEGR